VEYYGAVTPLKQLASVAVPDASTLLISPFDKGALKEIEKALNNSDLGINPNNDGEKVRLNIPPMTQVRARVGWRQGWRVSVCLHVAAAAAVAAVAAVAGSAWRHSLWHHNTRHCPPPPHTHTNTPHPHHRSVARS
jgi:hypothetical protein